MCGIICSATTAGVGALLVIASCVISFVVVPNVIENLIIGETVLYDDSIQMERFEEIPFPLNFSVRIFNISNSEQYVEGAVPVMNEIGPWVYKLYQSRIVESAEGDVIKYRRLEHFEFDAEASYPYTEDDMVTIINVPYHAIIQIAEARFSSLVPLLNLAMNGIFPGFNSPIATFRVQDLLFNGVQICANPGAIANIACNIIKEIGANAQNLEELEDGTMVFSVLGHKQDKPSPVYEAHRGLEDSYQLGEIITLDNQEFFAFWRNETIREDLVEVQRPGICNMINGTDSGIFAPFIDKSKNLYAINADVCRSVELRFEEDSEYEGIPTVRYSAKEWLLDNNEGCFCLNVTSGVTRENGCLLEGAMELYTCVGAMMVMSYPHFLFANEAYRDGVIGMSPDEEIHKIYMDIEPNTGTPVRGYKRGQFNIFSRRVSGIGATSSLRTTLVPIFWAEEGVAITEDYVDEITTKMLNPLRLVDIVIPILISICGVVLLLGIGFTIRVKCRKPKENKEEIGEENRID